MYPKIDPGVLNSKFLEFDSNLEKVTDWIQNVWDKSNDRQSKKISQIKSKSILAFLNADRELIDLSDSNSDWEEEQKSERRKRGYFLPSDDENEDIDQRLVEIC